MAYGRVGLSAPTLKIPPGLVRATLPRGLRRQAALPLGLRRRMAGMGAVTQSNPNAGTYGDLNCPNYCFLLGNVLDTSLFPEKCWPCHNVCPSGTAWDTANNQCSALPAEVNPVVPLDQVDPVTASIETITSNLGNYVPWIVGGLVAVMVLPAVLGRR